MRGRMIGTMRSPGPRGAMTIAFLSAALSWILVGQAGAAPFAAVAEGDGYIVRFSPSDLKLEPSADGTRVSFGDIIGTADAPGGPGLPIVPVVLEIPVTETATGVEVIAVEEQVVATHLDVAAAEKPAWGETVYPSPARNAELYAAEPLPASWVRVAGEGFARGHRLVTVHIAPARYAPKTGELRFAEVVRFRLQTAPATDRPREQRRTASEIEDRFTATLDRALGRTPAPVLARALPAAPTPLRITFPPSVDGSPVPYVIITSEAMAPAFQTLADWKMRKGLPGSDNVGPGGAAVVTTEWIDANYPNGADRAEQVRFFLEDAYSVWGTLWVLIGADTEIVPTRYVYSDLFVLPDEPSKVLPTDLYYACLDGNWNADKDDRVGEALVDGVDLMPELFVGRAPVTNLAEAQAYVQKTLDYERTPPVSARYPASVVFLAEDLGATDGAAIAEEAYAQVHSWMGRVRMYENHASYPGAIPLTKAAALDSINAGFGWVHHVGHGFRNTMSVGPTGQISNQDVDGLTNGGRQSFIFAINCSSASIDFNSIGERWLKNALGGGAGYVGTTRIAYPQVSRRYQNEFYRLAFADSVDTAGECLFMSRLPWVAGSESDNPDRWTQFALILLGDPDLPLWTNRPQQLAGQHLAAMTLGTGSFTTTVNAGGAPVNAARVTLWAEGEDYKSGLTGTGGDVTLPFDPETTGQFLITATRRNYLPYQGTATVNASATPFLFVDGVEVDDDNAGGSVGNGDGLTNPGETVWLRAALRNTGLSPATGITATLVCENGAEYVDIFTITVTYANIPAGGVASGQAHVVRIKTSAPIGFLPRFRIDIVANEGTWSDVFVLPVYAVAMDQYAHLWTDPAPGGNGNGVVEPGESVSYAVELRNSGIGQGVGVEGWLRVLNKLTGLPDPQVTVSDNFHAYGTMNPGERRSGGFAFSLSPTAVPANLRLELTVEDNYDTLTVERSDLQIPGAVDSLRAIGSTSTIRILWERPSDPDLYGFDVYRSIAPGGPFVRINSTTVVGMSFYEDFPLSPLSRYYYRVAARDSSFNTGVQSEVVSVSTNPPLTVGWPIEMSQVTTAGAQVYDFDRDGRAELVTGSDYIYAWRVDGLEVRDGDNDPRTSGPFTTWGYDRIAGFRGDPAIADLNRDGSFEIIFAGWGADAGEGKLHVLAPDGSQRPGWPRTFGFPFNWGSAVVGQIDADNSLEVVTMQGQNGVLYAFNHDGTELLNGDNNPSTIGPFFLTGTTFAYGGPALGNFDADALDEIVFGVNSANGRVYVLDGNGTLLPGWPRDTGGQITSTPAVADLDGDGRDEIVIAAEDDSVYVYRHDGSRYTGWPRWAKVFTPTSRTSSPIVVDLDRNGQLDILFAANDGRLHAWRRDGTVLPGWSNVLFAQDALDADATQSTPTVGDVDGDSQFEVLLGGEDGRLYGWNHDGTELAGFPILLEGEVRSSATITDFDGDGLVEIVVPGYDQKVYVWDMAGTYDPALVPWGTFRHDLRNTGNAGTSTQIGIDDPAAAAEFVSFKLWPARPNPFNPSTEITLDVPALPADSRVAIRIYDVSGRLARSLLEAPLAAGRHRFVWDGRDGEGQALPSGVYFLRADGPGFDAVRKLVLMK